MYRNVFFYKITVKINNKCVIFKSKSNNTAFKCAGIYWQQDFWSPQHPPVEGVTLALPNCWISSKGFTDTAWRERKILSGSKYRIFIIYIHLVFNDTDLLSRCILWHHRYGQMYCIPELNNQFWIKTYRQISLINTTRIVYNKGF